MYTIRKFLFALLLFLLASVACVWAAVVPTTPHLSQERISMKSTSGLQTPEVCFTTRNKKSPIEVLDYQNFLPISMTYSPGSGQTIQIKKRTQRQENLPQQIEKDIPVIISNSDPDGRVFYNISDDDVAQLLVIRQALAELSDGTKLQYDLSRAETLLDISPILENVGGLIELSLNSVNSMRRNLRIITIVSSIVYALGFIVIIGLVILIAVKDRQRRTIA